MKSSEYWKLRFQALEEESYQKGEACRKDIQEQFRIATNHMTREIEHWYQRLADNNNISLMAAKQLLNQNELKEFHWSVKQYIKAGKENAVDQRWMKQLENASARYHISHLEAMKLQMQQHCESLCTTYQNNVTDFLRESYQDTFYRTAYEIQKGTGIGSNLTKLDQKKIDTVLSKPWAADGSNFSNRIWKNKEKLVKELHTELSQSLIRGESPDKAIKHLTEKMEVSEKQVKRLVLTELAAIRSKSRLDSYKALDVEQYQIIAIIDSKTSELCQELNRKVFLLKDYEVGITAPPFHVCCRSDIIPYYGDDKDNNKETTIKNNSTKKAISKDITYQEWKETFVDGSNKTELKNVQIDDKIKTKSPREIVTEKQAKVDALEAEYISLTEINNRFDMDSSDFSTIEEKQAWEEWKEEFLKNSSINKIQDRLLEIYFELSDANGELAEARIQLLKSGTIEFKPSSNIREANIYAESILGIHAEYKGLDIRLVNEWNQALTKMKEVFPDLVNETFKFVGESHERNAIAKEIEFNRQLRRIKENNTYGWSDEQCTQRANERAAAFVKKYLENEDEIASSWLPGPPFDVCRGICINKDYFRDYEKALKSGITQVESKWHPEGCSTVKSNFDHEFGHQLDEWLGISMQKNIQDLFDSRTTSKLTNDLSEYAWNNQNEDRYSEMIAEAWSEYCNNPTPRPIAVEVGETIERLYVEWKRKNF